MKKQIFSSSAGASSYLYLNIKCFHYLVHPLLLRETAQQADARVSFETLLNITLVDLKTTFQWTRQFFLSCRSVKRIKPSTPACRSHLSRGVKPCSPVVSGVSDGSLAAQPVALLQVEGVVSVRIVSGLQLLCGQVRLLIEAAQQLAVLLGPRRLRHLPRTQHGVFTWSKQPQNS